MQCGDQNKRKLIQREGAKQTGRDSERDEELAMLKKNIIYNLKPSGIS